MKCEVCKAIERLGLDASVHDAWFCVDAEQKPRLATTVRKSRMIRNCRARWNRMKQAAFPTRLLAKSRVLDRRRERTRLMLSLRHLLTH